MATSESNSAELANDQTEWTTEVDRLGHLLDQLLTEFARINAENRQLQGTLRKAPGGKKGQEQQLAQVLEQLERERQSWEEQKQAIADRIEAILGKFQWLEAERKARSESVAGSPAN